ncbi:DNA-binding transcriptional LysR family regulator [Pseudomonas nitritireducens]|uniref:DNA-binding transcriptional LysR family regulator n=1 Tax=Pseudomonas nitroreducens TaxID=46680 RepID=A0A7W7KNE4_PSENT|nr:LysR family transcriptional regulator [Pseudomonas nitritireducens]MBB4865711.1 DNA-binding transcriptional LysR family regulator [Pseudomonas nitritireducens]
MYFDLADLRLICAIASTGSLSKAAASVPVAVSAASNRLRQFEERCGLALFTRHSDGMSPTPAGRLVLEAGQRVLREAQQLRDMLQELKGEKRITLRLGASTVANSTFLPTALGPFLADYPQVDLELIEQNSRDVLRAVQEGGVDIGVYDGNLPTTGLLSLPFRQDKLVLLVPHDHPLASQRLPSLRDALSFPFVGLPAERAMQRFVEAMAVRNAMPLKVRVRAPSFDAIAQLVAQRVGVSMLPEAAATRLAQELPVSVVPLEDAWATRELRLCVASWDALSSHARQLVTYLMGEGR